MSTSNEWQLWGLFLMMGFGFAAGFVFDLLRVWRVLTHPSPPKVFVQDVLFCVGSATAFFFCLIPLTGGAVRGPFLLGAAAGGAVYFATCGRILLPAVRWVLRLWRRITAPIRLAGRFVFGALTGAIRAVFRPLCRRGRIWVKKVKLFIKKVLQVRG